ncbi:hypothetical protein DY000_02017798 [Brassica cretica]|uniref:Replication protein A 70 kDa DNA-binding subunit B/D first OB fold domain-containing protein n=1 Tax=Brassica cretica TaxID=69181 RepID=A0ABQ7D910_BRACR|nr:hypothetical protein DY000_02017798 [Brassica cretica]
MTMIVSPLPVTELDINGINTDAQLLRYWEARNVKRGGELMWVDMLLVDVNATMMQATISAHRLPQCQERLTAGAMYSIADFNVARCAQNFRLSDSSLMIRFNKSTSFDEIDDPVSAFPEEAFRFRDQSELLGLANTNTQLPADIACDRWVFSTKRPPLSVAGVDDGQRRPLYLLLFSTNENDDISLSVSFLSSAKGEISPNWWLCSMIRRRLCRWLSSRKGNGDLSLFLSSPRRKTASSVSGESEDSSTSQADSKKCPPGVKASKASGKKTVDHEKTSGEADKTTREWRVRRDDERVTSKKRKCEDGADSSTSQADSKKCPPGVKASKASGKKTVDHEKTIPAEVMADLYSCITGEWRGRQDHERVESQTRRRESGVRQDRVVLYCLVHGHKMTQ